MGDYPSNENPWWWVKDKNHCVYCGVELGRHNRSKDHVIPKSRRRKDEEYVNGTVPACTPCNRDKNDHLPGEWLEVMVAEQERLQRRLGVLEQRITRLQQLRRVPLFMRAWTSRSRVVSALSGTSKSRS